MDEELLTRSENEETDARVYYPPYASQSSNSGHFNSNPILKQGLPSLPPPINTPKDPKTVSPEAKTVYFLPKDASTYELDKFKENRMIIINNDHFLKGKSRPGSWQDEKKLRATFTKYRFNIDDTYDNLEMKPLLKKVKDFALDTDFSLYGCVCVAILTHGNKTKPGQLKAYDNWYSEHDIFKHFDASKNHTLAAKPIIFIIQACRGPEASPIVIVGGKTTAPQLDSCEELENYHLPTDCDRIVFHSSYLGKAAVRHPKDGSWFIQKLCDKVQEFGLTHDMETIFRMVRRVVALDCVTDEDWKQMPVVTCTLLRELRLAATVQKNSLQGCAGSSARPCSPAVSQCQINPDVLLSDQLEELQVPLEESTENSVPECSPVQMMFHLRPCCCFLDYFDYLKDCLDSFCKHNTEDMVAKSLLAIVAKIDSGPEYNMQKFSFIQHMWEHLESNKHLFPPDGFKFLHRTIFVPLNKTDTSIPLGSTDTKAKEQRLVDLDAKRDELNTGQPLDIRYYYVNGVQKFYARFHR